MWRSIPLVLSFLAACGGTPEAAAPVAEAPADLSAVDPAAVEALAAYDRVHAALIADDLAGAQREAAVLAVSAERSAATAELAKAALALAAAADLDAARLAHGDASRAVLALIGENPALAQGRHAFTCPMAKGYQKWVQTDEKLANPYMGTKMLACGSATDLAL